MVQLYAISEEEATPLQLLREVRDAMMGADSVQAKLDALTQRIATGFRAEVCSIYLMRVGRILELVATAGLHPASVHVTRLSAGEGLVGHIATTGEALNIADAQSHDKFLYKAETREDEYQSFVGVPILSNHQMVGVLVVQRVRAEQCSEDQLEVLQTVAMVLSELTISQSLVNLQELMRDRTEPHGQAHRGQSLSTGLAQAPVVLHRPHVEIERLLSDDPDAEEARFRVSLAQLSERMDELIDAADFGDETTHIDILETYRMFTQDKGWVRSIVQAIQSGLSAEAAVKKVLEDLHVRLSQVTNVHVRQRIEDLEDISTRLLYHLVGKSYTAAASDLPDAFILVSHSMGPSELLEYGHGRIKGLILEKGSAASHITIIARMLDIPMVAGVDNATNVMRSGDEVVLDGDHGNVFVRPSGYFRQEIDEHLASRKKQTEAYAAMRDLPPVTKDEEHIGIFLNIGLHLDAAEIDAMDVSGIGLYRTELPYLASPVLPDVAHQASIYRTIVEQAGDKPVVFRTFDIGGDKQVPYVRSVAEENPAMGWRGSRIGLDQPALLRQQFRALLEATAGHDLHVMFPMIATASEFQAARALLDLEMQARVAQQREMPTAVRVGVMVEVPSLLYDLQHVLSQVDFISIGSNDLLQFFFAADRGSDHVSGRYDVLHPAALRMLREVVGKCADAGVEVSFCGDMATRPLEAMALMACGVRNVSVSPRAIGPLKQMIRSVDVAQVTDYMDMICDWPETSLRSHLKAFARDHGVVL